MSISTLPRVAGLDYDGHPAYAAHLLAGDPHPKATNVVWLDAPVMSEQEIAYLRWATDAEVPTPHASLDQAGLAHLLFSSEVPLDSAATAEQVLAVALAELARIRCDLDRCRCAVAYEYGEHPETAAAHMALCVVLSARLLGTVV